jgi:hypothetical protein
MLAPKVGRPRLLTSSYNTNRHHCASWVPRPGVQPDDRTATVVRQLMRNRIGHDLGSRLSAAERPVIADMSEGRRVTLTPPAGFSWAGGRSGAGRVAMRHRNC